MNEEIMKLQDELEEISHSLSQQDISEVIDNERRICFICCNSYTEPEFH